MTPTEARTLARNIATEVYREGLRGEPAYEQVRVRVIQSLHDRPEEPRHRPGLYVNPNIQHYDVEQRVIDIALYQIVEMGA